MGFGDKVNERLIKDGKKPMNKELIEAMNDAMKKTVIKLKKALTAIPNKREEER